MKLTPLSLLLLLSLSPAASSSAEPLAFSELSASPSFGIPADLTVSPEIYGENLHSIQYVNGVLACRLEAPRVGESESCPALGLKVVVKEHLEVSRELAAFLTEPREGGDETESRRFWLGPDWILHYMPGSTDFRKPIEQYFLPGTQVRAQWATRTALSDVLFLVAETCAQPSECRAGLWVFVAKGGTFQLALIPLPRTSLWQKLEPGSGLGLFSVADSFALVLPNAGSPAVIAWVVRFRESARLGITEAHFEAHAATWVTEDH